MRIDNCQHINIYNYLLNRQITNTMASVHNAIEFRDASFEGEASSERDVDNMASQNGDIARVSGQKMWRQQKKQKKMRNILLVVISVLIIAIFFMTREIIKITPIENSPTNAEEKGTSGTNPDNGSANKQIPIKKQEPKLSIPQPQQPKQILKPAQEPVKPIQTSNPDLVPIINVPHMAGYTHKHQGLTFAYPTVGIPEPGKVYNSTRVKEQDLQQFDEEVYSIFQPHNDTNCQFTRMGDEDSNDGGYVFCKNFINQSEGLINIGVNGYDNFGCQISTVNPKLINYQYDCTNPRKPLCTTNQNRNNFNFVCLGSVTQKTTSKEFHTLEYIIKKHKLMGKRLTLKIDSEGGEYPGFKYFPAQYLDYFDQIVGEIHFHDLYYEEWGALDIFRSLMSKFVNVNLHMNNWGCFKQGSTRKLNSKAIEVSLVNKKLIKLNSESRSFALHPLNKPNGKMKDCQYLAP